MRSWAWQSLSGRGQPGRSLTATGRSHGDPGDRDYRPPVSRLTTSDKHHGGASVGRAHKRSVRGSRVKHVHRMPACGGVRDGATGPPAGVDGPSLTARDHGVAVEERDPAGGSRGGWPHDRGVGHPASHRDCRLRGGNGDRGVPASHGRRRSSAAERTEPVIAAGDGLQADAPARVSVIRGADDCPPRTPSRPVPSDDRPTIVREPELPRATSA
jgi:hypothetical protein